jgi:sugar lactone lactonase YvrE
MKIPTPQRLKHFPSIAFAVRLSRGLAALGCLALSTNCLHATATIITLGGGAVSAPYSGYVNGNTLTASRFAQPTGLALDPSGTYLFVADYTNNAIRLVSQLGNTATSMTTTFANATNSGTVGVNRPIALVVDSATNIYVLNRGNGANGAVLHLGGAMMASGAAVVYPVLATNLANATAIAMDGNNNLYVTVNGNKVIRVTTNKVVTTIGTISQAGTSLQGIAVLDNGRLALSDAGNNGIWIMNPLTGTSSQLTGFHGAGDALGLASSASFNAPKQIAKAAGGMLVLTDYGNHKVKLIDQSGTVSLLYGVSSNLWITGTGQFPGWREGTCTAVQGGAEARWPYGVIVAADGSVFVSETYYHIIRHVTGTGLGGPQPGYLPTLGGLSGIAYDSLGDYLFIANYNSNIVQALDLLNNQTTSFLSVADGIQNPISVLVDADENVYVLNQGTLGNGFIQEYDIYGNNYGPIVTGLNQPTAFTLDGYGNLFVTEKAGNIRAFGAGVSNTIVTIATNANVSLQGIALFDDGTIAASDAGNHVIWTVNPITKLISKLTGQIGTNGFTVGASNFAKLYQPHQLSRAGGNALVAADTGNNRVVFVQRNGTVTTNNLTYHLNPTNALIWYGTPSDPITSTNSRFVSMVSPVGVAVANGGEVFDSETTYNVIRGMQNTGISAAASTPGVPLPIYASLGGIALNNEGTSLFVADPTNNTIHQLNLANNQTAQFLDSTAGLDLPVDVALDSSDNVYILNQGNGGNGEILLFDEFGNFLDTIASGLSRPTAMKLTFTGEIYVTEMNGVVQKLDFTGLNTVATINTNANVNLQGVAVLDNGNIVVSDAGNHVIWKIAGTNRPALFTGVIGSPGTNFGGAGSAKLNKPMRLAQAKAGLLLVADAGNNRVVVANDAGTVSKALVSTNANIWFGLPIDPVAPGTPNFVPMLSPVGLAIGPGTNATVYASESVYKDVRGIFKSGLQAPIAPPHAPLNLVATASYGEVDLSWSAVSGTTNYLVKRATSTNSFLSVVGNTTDTAYADTNVISGSTYYYVVTAVNGGGAGPDSEIVSATPLIAPPPAPRIGWFDYEGNAIDGFYTTLHPISKVSYHNDQLIAIDPVTNGVSTYYTLDGTDPSTDNGSTPPPYQDGWGYAQSLSLPASPDIMIKAINVDSIGQVSPITTAEFIFKTANPVFSGNNAALFRFSDVTTNATIWYYVATNTSDNTLPTNAPPCIGPIAANQNISLPITSNTIVRAIAFRNGYYPSGVSVQSFSPSNFTANTISFGFASGEASSDFLASPGQTFYAPVTLSTLPGTVIYSLQFNLTVTNAGPNPGPAVAPNAFGFQTMLMKPDGDHPGLFFPIPPMAYAAPGTRPRPTATALLYGGNWFEDLESVNTAENLLAVGWLERAGKTNLYDTTAQDLIKYSMAHDDLFPNPQSPNNVIVGGYSFVVPGTATNGQTYQIQIGRPSATLDGIGMPGADVYLAAPTNGSTLGGAPINALKYVTVGQRKYLAGSVYPFRWFNAGDFGSSNIVNADVEQVFQSAIYGLNSPPPGSDFFDAMDSCGSLGVADSNPSEVNYGYFTNAGTYGAAYPTTANYTVDSYTIYYDTNNVPTNTIVWHHSGSTTYSGNSPYFIVNAPYYTTNIYPYDPTLNNVSTDTQAMEFYTQLNVLFNGNDTTINQIAFGDGNLDVCDVFVTFRRSLDPGLTWFRRFWNGGQLVADTNAPNVASHALVKSAVQSKALSNPSASTNPLVAPLVNFSAGDVQGAAGQVVQVPIKVSIVGNYPLRVLMLNLTVEPLDGAPALATPVQFSQTAAILGAPLTTTSEGNDNFAAVWLNSTNAGITGTTTIGTLFVTIPANAAANAAYAIHFDHASASPNGLASFPKQTLTGLVTIGSRSNSIYGDAIPDSWRLRWFGTAYNILSVSNACPSGDGVNNWLKFIAGVDPNVANNFPALNAKKPVPSGASTAIHWPSVNGKKYVIERASALFGTSWTVLSTNTGTGGDMEFDDSNKAPVKFYRVRIVP